MTELAGMALLAVAVVAGHVRVLAELRRIEKRFFPDGPILDFGEGACYPWQMNEGNSGDERS